MAEGARPGTAAELAEEGHWPAGTLPPAAWSRCPPGCPAHAHRHPATLEEQHCCCCWARLQAEQRRPLQRHWRQRSAEAGGRQHEACWKGQTAWTACLHRVRGAAATTLELCAHTPASHCTSAAAALTGCIVSCTAAFHEPFTSASPAAVQRSCPSLTAASTSASCCAAEQPRRTWDPCW